MEQQEKPVGARLCAVPGVNSARRHDADGEHHAEISTRQHPSSIGQDTSIAVKADWQGAQNACSVAS